jgi:zinc carboxypeptidase
MPEAGDKMRSMRGMLPVACGLVLGVWMAAGPTVRGQVMDLGFLTTRAEASNYEETTRYDEVMGFLEVAAAQSANIHLTHFGYSVEGRKLPLVVWGTPSADPELVRSDSRLRVFIQANIHAGEVCGKEAMLAMIRDLAAGRYDAWSDSLVLLIAPIYNADGNERVSLFNRPRQNGPTGGMGQRPNAQDLDLNRDHMKLASPEARSLVRLMNAYDPHVLIDLHTTNGSRHAYHLTYSPPLNPNTHPAIDGLLRDDLLPSVTNTIRDKYGWEFYYYGNMPFRGGDPGWYTFDHRPRFNNNYVGLRNRVAILSEAYAYASFSDRIAASRAFVEEIVDYAGHHATEIRHRIEEADSARLAGRSFALRSGFKRSEEKVDILMGSAERVRNPFSGADLMVMTDERRVETMYEYGAFEATESTTVPASYVIPSSLRSVRRLLDDHGIRYRILEEPTEVLAQRFAIDSTSVGQRPFQGVKQRTLFGSYQEFETVLEAGSLIAETGQPLGRLLVYLLEPRSDDGVVNWGLLDDAVEDASFYPVLRLADAP